MTSLIREYTLRVQSHKEPPDYIEQALSKFSLHEVVILSGVGRAVETASSCAQILNDRNIARIRKIHTSTVEFENKNEPKKPHTKPTIQITLSQILPARWLAHTVLKKEYLSLPRNNFGGILVDRVIIDSGCDSVLLPLKPDQLADELLGLFESDQYDWIFTFSKSTSGVSPTLQIKGTIQVQLPISIDTYSTTSVDLLRFQLCRDDISVLLNMDDLDLIDLKFQGVSKDVVTRDLHKFPNNRLDHGLLGFIFLKQKDCVELAHRNTRVLLEVGNDDWNLLRASMRYYEKLSMYNQIDTNDVFREYAYVDNVDLLK